MNPLDIVLRKVPSASAIEVVFVHGEERLLSAMVRELDDAFDSARSYRSEEYPGTRELETMNAQAVYDPARSKWLMAFVHNGEVLGDLLDVEGIGGLCDLAVRARINFVFGSDPSDPSFGADDEEGIGETVVTVLRRVKD